MTLIRKIINWLKRLFNKWFGKKKVTKKIKNNLTNAKNKKYLKGYGIFLEESYNETFPIYLMISDEEKHKLIKKIEKIKQNIELIGDKEKEEELEKLNKIIKKIEKSEISVYQNNQLNEKIDNYLDEKIHQAKTLKKHENIYNEIFDIIDNFNEVIRDKAIKEYKYVNYVTLTTLLIDETKKELWELEESFKKHKYNKSYYDRKLNMIKQRVLNLRRIRDGINIQHEIDILKKDLYTKGKDKYDLLYNEEVFLGLQKECDDLLKKVDRRVIDIKKIQVEKKEEKEKDIKNNDEKELLENILKRFQDIELAQKILFINNQERNFQIQNINELLSYINSIYMDFLNGEKVIFHFERNKTKTELVKLYNNINRLSCYLKEEEYTSLDHINYQLDDLIYVTENKKAELECLLEEKYNYQKDKHEESILVNNKINILKEKEMEKEEKKHILVKVNDNQEK